jgi:phosphotransferase family enzyme
MARSLAACAPDVASLLAAHGVSGSEVACASNGYSGARITAIECEGNRYLLKRVRYTDDWIMQVVGDRECREAHFAVSPLVARMPAHVRVPTLGAARDGDGFALLMGDITPLLLPEEGILTADTVGRVLAALAEMHAAFWDDDSDAGFDLSLTAQRIRMTGPSVGEMLLARGIDIGFSRGWQRFDALAPSGVAPVVRRLLDDPAPILDALSKLPSTLLHGDAKFGNMGVDGDDLWLFDWAIVLRAPVAFELAWFLAVNSSRLPWSLDETMERYRAHLEHALGAARYAVADWPAQQAATMLIGLMLYGWGKALDADDGRPQELAWWCEGADAAIRRFGW